MDRRSFTAKALTVLAALPFVGRAFAETPRPGEVFRNAGKVRRPKCEDYRPSGQQLHIRGHVFELYGHKDGSHLWENQSPVWYDDGYPDKFCVGRLTRMRLACLVGARAAWDDVFRTSCVFEGGVEGMCVTHKPTPRQVVSRGFLHKAGHVAVHPDDPAKMAAFDVVFLLEHSQYFDEPAPKEVSVSDDGTCNYLVELTLPRVAGT